jgi:phage terminase large subunit-like protein
VSQRAAWLWAITLASCLITAMTFNFTAKQLKAQELLGSSATHILLDGGSRSGKTFLFVRAIVARALKAPGSRHAILRFRFNHVKTSVVHDTFPKVMQLAFPDVRYRIDKSDWYAPLPNDSEVWFGGLDDKERTEKILGKEYATILLNECSQIALSARDVAVTRLAQKVMCKIDGKPDTLLTRRMYYDCNPPPKSHWTYRMFHEKVNPETKRALEQPADYAFLQINPEDNLENLPPGYIDTLKSLSPRLQKRFLRGEYADATQNQLFPDEHIDKWRHLSGELPDMVRIVVGVDPSGSGDVDNADNDEIGIAVGGLGADGNAYLLEDCSVKAGPATWGRVATSAYERHEANVVVGEVNYGGAMVAHVIQTARPRTPYKPITASRGKAVRAEPFSALYEAGKVRHVGNFIELEDELSGFSTAGYLGNGSPNRADAWIWVLAELFPGLVKKRDAAGPKPQAEFIQASSQEEASTGWMAS